MFEKGKHIFRKFVRKSVDFSNECSYNTEQNKCSRTYERLGDINMNRNYNRRNNVNSFEYRDYKRAIAKAKRSNIVMMQYTAIIALFIMALIVSILFISSNAYANNNSNDRVKKYKSVMIYGGDSMETIADKNITDEYKTEAKFIKEVCAINNITEDTKLVPGNHIIVPYYDDANYITFELAE